LDEQIHLTAEVGAGHADHGAHGGAEEGTREPHDHGRARPVDDSREDVATEGIGPQPVRRRGPRQHRAVVGGERIVGGEDVGAEGHDDVDEDDHGTDRAQRTLADEVFRRRPPARPAPGDLRNFGERVGGSDGHVTPPSLSWARAPGARFSAMSLLASPRDASRLALRPAPRRDPGLRSFVPMMRGATSRATVPHLNLIRGSIHAYARSTMKLTKMKTKATSSTSACVRV